MALFHDNVLKLEREINSVIEVINIIDHVAGALRDRIENEFLPFSVKNILSKLQADGNDKECANFVQKAIGVYEEAEAYLLKWTASLSDFRVNIFAALYIRPSFFGRNVLIRVLFQVFKWLDFRQDVRFRYSCIEDTVSFLKTGTLFLTTASFSIKL